MNSIDFGIVNVQGKRVAELWDQGTRDAGFLYAAATLKGR